MPWAGRVEVYIKGEWGTVCGKEFDSNEGNIVCRNLGYGSVKSIRGFGIGVGAIHLKCLE